MWVQSLGWKDPLEEGMATHSSILAWRIPWTEGPGGLQSMVWQKSWTPLRQLSTHSTYILYTHTSSDHLPEDYESFLSPPSVHPDSSHFFPRLPIALV